MRRRSVGALLLVAALTAGSGLAGCTAARNGLGTGASQCFRVLPEARAAVGKAATFEGVTKARGSVLVKALESPGLAATPPEALRQMSRRTTCAVAYRGHFSVAGVARGWAAEPTGPYHAGVVVMDLSDERVIATLLFRKVTRPIEFLYRPDGAA
ncbi:MAG: hypothetical protein ACLQNG_06630 [Acidimicrobiales bacterium]|jgi:hypothetical protein